MTRWELNSVLSYYKPHTFSTFFGEEKERNKRAQRALGRSPEENVKGQGEAIYRGPLMLSTKYC